MTIQLLTKLLIGCTAINAGLMLLWAICFRFAPDLVYRTQSKWFPISRENFSLVIYLFLALYKIFFLFFNVVPLVVLLYVTSG